MKTLVLFVVCFVLVFGAIANAAPDMKYSSNWEIAYEASTDGDDPAEEDAAWTSMYPGYTWIADAQISGGILTTTSDSAKNDGYWYQTPTAGQPLPGPSLGSQGPQQRQIKI